MRSLVLLLLALLTPLTASAIPLDCKITLEPRTSPEIAARQILESAGVRIGESGSSDIAIHDPAFYRRVLADPEFEIGETYMDGLWDSPHIDQLTTKLYQAQLREGRLRSFAPLWRAPVLAARAILKSGYRYFRDRLTNRQSRKLSTRVATEHYDAGNELYRRMLDPTMTYTSGVWADGFTLEDAQNAKYDLIARKLGLKPGDHVLDIGSGFGGFARFAAKNYGAKVTGITISVEQLRAARELSSGVSGVDFVFSDYRDLAFRFAPGTFDHVVSIEMIEAVGPKNLEAYFQSAHAVLKDGGRFVIQGINNNEDVFNTNPWFSKYIFQDGVAPSNAQVDRAATGTFGPAVDRQRITGDYVKTLLAWHDSFTKAWPDLKSEYSERFKRMWDFYLLSVAGGFRSGALELDQSVFVKGERPLGFTPVRDLPSRSRLTALRATPEQIEKTALTISELETGKQEIVAAAAPRAEGPRTPLAKDTRIAVIGAGPSGLSAARELKRLGYGNVVVFEKENEAGGKTHTVEFDGRPHDLGATMGVKLKYAEIERLAREQDQQTIPFPKEVDYSLSAGGPVKASFSDALRKKFQGLLYLVHHVRTAGIGPRALEVPPAELADPWSVVMGRAGIGFFGEELKTYLTGYGYGGPDTPAVFGERMFDTNTIIGAALSDPIMWQNGTQPIWQGVAKDLNVRTGTEVESITRIENQAKGAIRIHVKDASAPEVFDKLILAVDPRAALKMLEPTREESALFSRVKYMPYATFAVRVVGLAAGRAEVGYLRENMTLEREGWPMAWIKRYADDDLFVFHLFAPPEISDEQIVANISTNVRRLGATRVTYVDSRRWPFFPHVDSTSMRELKFYERVRNLQGQHDTVFANEALAMSTMPDSAALGVKSAQRLASGEYHR